MEQIIWILTHLHSPLQKWTTKEKYYYDSFSRELYKLKYFNNEGILIDVNDEYIDRKLNSDYSLKLKSKSAYGHPSIIDLTRYCNNISFSHEIELLIKKHLDIQLVRIFVDINLPNRAEVYRETLKTLELNPELKNKFINALPEFHELIKQFVPAFRNVDLSTVTVWDIDLEQFPKRKDKWLFNILLSLGIVIVIVLALGVIVLALGIMPIVILIILLRKLFNS